MSLFRYIFFVFPFFLVGQSTFTIQDDFILFEEAATGEPILVYNDSMAVRGFDFKEHFKISFPEGLKLAYFDNYHYQIGDATYLVDDGGGVVLQFIDNSFKRIDNLFRHKNQYQAVPFVKDSTLYLYGGYGLFTHKNILTKYSFETKEWDRIQMKNKDIVPPSTNSLFWQTADALYVFAGKVEDTNNIFKYTPSPNNVWKLNLEDLVWQVTGKHNLYSAFPKFNNFRKFRIDDKLVLLRYDINEIDIARNEINKYKIKDYKALKKIIYHKKSGRVSAVCNNSKDQLFAMSKPYTDFKGEFISTTPFYTKPTATNNLTFLYISLAVLVIILVFVIFRVKKTPIPKDNVIFYDLTKDAFSYNNKTIKTLSQYKKQLLIGFMKHGYNYILLNELNDLLNKDADKNENFAAVQKRRETLLKELKSDLSIILNMSEDKVFSVRKYKYDKRLKEIRLEIKILQK